MDDLQCSPLRSSSAGGRPDLHAAPGTSTTDIMASVDELLDPHPLAHSFHTKMMVPPMVTNWVADSNASNHTTFSAGNLTSVRPPLPTDPSSIVVGNGSSFLVTSVGNMDFSVHFTLILSLLLPTLFKIFYLFVVSLLIIDVLLSLTPMTFL
jgi:hypothetical protein